MIARFRSFIVRRLCPCSESYCGSWVKFNNNRLQQRSPGNFPSVVCRFSTKARKKVGEEESPSGEGSTQKKITKKSKPSAAVKAVIEYVDEYSGWTDLKASDVLPSQYLRPVKNVPTCVYLINKYVAKEFADVIKSENPDLDSPVVEIHPGLGLLTKELLNTVGFKYVTGLEDSAAMRENLAGRFGISLIAANVDNLPRQHHLDKHDGGDRINQILNSINTGGAKEHGSKTRKLYLIGAIPNVSTIHFLIRSYVTKRIFYEDELPWSGVTLFCAIGPKAHCISTATPETGFVAYRPTSVLFQTLFKSKELTAFPRKAFVPWEIEDKVVKKGLQSRRLKVSNPDLVKLCRLEINEETVQKVGRDGLLTYWYFVRQHLHARTSRIIPDLERWIPGCGLRLIKQGFTIYSQFGDLQPEELLDLYLQFVSWPEFANSSFMNAVEKFQTRIEVHDEDDNIDYHNKNE